GRKHQEDRFTVCPALIPGRNDAAFFGVFDGTVGDFASDSVKDLVVPHLLSSSGWQRVVSLLQEPGESAAAAAVSAAAAAALPEALAAAVRCMYLAADAELIELCRLQQNDYASSTSVTAVMAGGFVAIGHLGDSRIALGLELEGGGLEGEFATVDHKPNMPLEQERIMSSGGSVEYLHNHNNKPFIRGGDFGLRKSKGEQPMQLQYSRAFGGKDLKTYGLSAEPDVRVLRLSSSHKLMVLATDGLWDVLSATQAVQIAWDAQQQGENPAESLVQHALADQQQSGHCADNITAMVVFFKS
ncbi:serine-threonine phosophatase 2C, putative, partial [Eimeria tenella]